MKFDDLFGSGANQAPSTGVTIESATIWIYLNAQWGSAATQELDIYPMLTSWDRASASWSYRAYDGGVPVAYWGAGSSATNGPVANVDYDVGFLTVADFSNASAGSWIALDVTDIVQAWHSGSLANNGIIAFGDGVYQGLMGCSMTTGTTSPILQIDYKEQSLTTVSFQEGQDGYASTECSTIQGNNPLSRINDWRLYAFGLPESSAASAGMIRFDDIFGGSLNQVPASGAMIESAMLHLYLEGTWGSSTQTFTAYPLLKSWNRDEVTWSYRGHDGSAPTEYWGNVSVATAGPLPGIDYDDAFYAVGDYAGAPVDSWISVDVTDIVQSWYDGGLDNHGLLLFGGGVYNGMYARSEGQGLYSPRLEVTYLGGDSTPPPGDDLIESISVSGDEFLRSGDQSPMRFWAVNCVAFYPDHATADAYAAFLADRGVNCVRWHHMLRPSLDWNVKSGISALVSYANNTSRELDGNALERFDYLNARLREHGIYVTFAMRFTRNYLPGDVSIQSTTSADEQAWQAAMADLNDSHWQFSIDKKKMLPVFDERAALIDEEFVTNLLSHVNPYTGLSYGEDPQVFALETINEFSSEYVIVAGNKFLSDDFPAVSYWTDLLNNQWDAYTSTHGVTPCDIYSPSTTAQREARSDFLDELDRAHFQRMKNHIDSLGYDKALIFSNLWRGERPLKMNADMGDYIENHGYVRPEVTDTLDDWVRSLSKCAIAGKPYIISEFNQREGSGNRAEDDPKRTMLMAAAATYGLLQGWNGFTWFAWNHGDGSVASDGQGDPVTRDSNLGAMVADSMMQDHMRAAGLIFRRGLFGRSQSPITVYVDDPLWQSSYYGLIAEKYSYEAGWQNLHEIRKSFGAKSSGQDSAFFMTSEPTGDVLVSDTGEIAKDIVRNQLTGAAEQAEVFSGSLDGMAPAGLQHLDIVDSSGFATVMLVTEDAAPIVDSGYLLVSRTMFDSTGNDVAGPDLTISGLKAPATGEVWRFYVNGNSQSLSYVGGSVMLPTSDWREGEIVLE